MQKKSTSQELSMPILDRVASVIHTHKLLREHDRVIVAVSGGADSLALLHILAGIDMALDLVAVYIDHQLRPQETPHEQKTIEASCLALKIPFKVSTVNVNELVAKGKYSPEEAARILRYRSLDEARHEYGARVIAVGHTADDQVEEFFIRLIRGSSSRGLSGMRLKRDHIIRPLLFENKALLTDFLSGLGVPWCLDSSNLDRQFLRNRVRLDLLPFLEEKFNPALRKTILQSMDVLAEEDEFLEQQTLKAFAQCIEFSDVPTTQGKCAQLIVKGENFLKIHLAIRRRIIEKCCWKMGIRPTYEQIRTIAEFVESGKNHSEIHLGDGVRAEKSAQQHLLLSRPLPKGLVRGSRQPASSIDRTIPGPGIYLIDDAKKKLILEEISLTAGHEKADGELRVDLGKISYPLQLRSFLPGERFQPYGNPGRKKISRYFNELKIPTKERPSWPVLLREDKVIALIGLQLDHNFRITSSTKKVLSIRWIDGNK